MSLKTGILASVVALSPIAADATPVLALPNFEKIVVFEATSGVVAFDILADDLTREDDPLITPDFTTGASGELYDVYTSDADGAFDANGRFVTVSTVFNNSGGGGGNVTAVDLFWGNGMKERASILSASAAFGNGSFPNSALFAVDGNETTNTTLGSTTGDQNDDGERLFVTVGFNATTAVVPLPAAGWMLIAALAGLLGVRRSRRV